MRGHQRSRYRPPMQGIPMPRHGMAWFYHTPSAVYSKALGRPGVTAGRAWNQDLVPDPPKISRSAPQNACSGGRPSSVRLYLGADGGRMVPPALGSAGWRFFPSMGL